MRQADRRSGPAQQARAFALACLLPGMVWAQVLPPDDAEGDAADIVVRIVAQRTVYDFAVPLRDEPVRRLGAYRDDPSGNGVPPRRDFARRGLGWKVWAERNRDAAARLETTLGSGAGYLLAVFADDGALLALARAVEGDPAAAEVLIVRSADLAIVARRRLARSRMIADLAWMPRSGALVVLEKAERTPLWPWEIAASLAGHTLPQISFYLVRLDSSSGAYSAPEEPIVRDVAGGWGALLVRRAPEARLVPAE